MQTVRLRANQSALRQGLVFGTILGAMLLISNLAINLANLDATREIWVKNSALIVMFILPALAGFVGSKGTGQVKTGVRVVLVTEFVSAFIGVLSLWLITLVFIDLLRHNALMMIDFQQSGMPSIEAFILQGALGGSIFLFVFSIAFGAGYGLLGSLLGAHFALFRNRQHQNRTGLDAR